MSLVIFYLLLLLLLLLLLGTFSITSLTISFMAASGISLACSAVLRMSSKISLGPSLHFRAYLCEMIEWYKIIEHNTLQIIIISLHL